ncbi:MAG: hypothetical protein GDA41_05800 [Rhodospirillales bacterium]|nr:hypothetical protein [Rhodospirillales bacterium]
MFDGQWFNPVQADSIYESDLEDLIIKQAPVIYPNYWVIKYKRVIASEYGTAIPDLAFIEKSYRAWYLCEVELGSHDLFAHVMPQVSVFCNALVGRAEACYLAKKETMLDVSQLTAMMQGVRPGVLVLVNAFDPRWWRALTESGALVGLIELYRDSGQRFIMRINGDDLHIPEQLISECVRDKLLPNALRVSAPAPIDQLANPDLELWYEGGRTVWKVLRTGGSCWLLPKERCPLRVKDQRYIITRDTNARVRLERAKK